jgi:hypothetical protein
VKLKGMLARAGIIAIATALSFAAYSADSTSSTSILGYLDPTTGTFKVAPIRSALVDATATNVTGEIKVTATFTVVSTLSASTAFTCSALAILVPEGPITEEASVAATHSGSTVTCTVPVPYEWALASASTDEVTVGITVQGIESSGLIRLSTRQLPSFKVPESGVTTSLSVVGRL